MKNKYIGLLLSFALINNISSMERDTNIDKANNGKIINILDIPTELLAKIFIDIIDINIEQWDGITDLKEIEAGIMKDVLNSQLICKDFSKFMKHINFNLKKVIPVRNYIEHRSQDKILEYNKNREKKTSRLLKILKKYGINKTNREEVINLICNGAIYNMGTDNGITALIAASIQGDTEIVELLISKNANINARERTFNATALDHAIRSNNIDIAKLLINAYTQANCSITINYGTIFWIVSEEDYEDYTDMVELLIDKGFNFNIKKNNIGSALTVAIRNNNNNIAKLIINKGTNTDENEKINALSAAICYKNKELIDLLLSYEYSSNGYGLALITAVRQNNKELINLFLTKDININAKDNDTNTALMYAACSGNLDVVKLLINANADVNAINKNGNTALMYAAYNGNLGVAKLLIDANADINATDRCGDNALILAMLKKEKNKELIKLLKDNGADINTKKKYN